MKRALVLALAFSLAAAPALAAMNTPPVPGQLPGTATNDNAAAGNVGEYISSTVLVGAAIGLTTTTPANLTSISLPPGDWTVWGNIVDTPGAGTVRTLLTTTLSTTSATLSTDLGLRGLTSVFATNGTVALAQPPIRFSLSVTTTIFFVVRADFSTNTEGVYGFIAARRAR